MVDEKESLSPFRSFLFPHIFRSFRMAIQPSRLAVAFAALTAICLTGWLMDLNPTVIVTDGATEIDLYVVSARQFPTLLDAPSPSRNRVGMFTTLWHFGGVQFHAALDAIFRFDASGFVASIIRCAKAIAWAFRYHTLYSVIFFSVVLVALSLAGGAICRMGAIEFARGDRPGLGRACRFAGRKFTSLIATPVAPLVIALLLGLPIIVLGALGNIPYAGELIAGLLLPLALVLAPFIVVVLIGAAAGLSLMFPAIAYEDSDFFDAISRSFSNVYAKPWRMGFYTLTAALYGAVCYLFVRFFAFLLLWVTRGFLQVGLSNEKLRAIWPEPVFDNLLGTAAAAPEVWSLWLAAFLIRVWVLVVIGLLVSFLLSFYFSAGTIIYDLMRNRVDGTPLDEVYEAPEETARGSDSMVDLAPGTLPNQAAGQASRTSE